MKHRASRFRVYANVNLLQSLRETLVIQKLVVRNDVAPSYHCRIQPARFTFAEGAFAAWFLKIDEEVLKPFLIRKYDKVVMEMQEAYNQMIA